jgi:integrase
MASRGGNYACAMEAIGVDWRPVFHALADAGGFEIVLCNAHHVKKVPGRKTDLLTELLRGFRGGCLPGRVRLASFAARDRRWRTAAGFGGAGARCISDERFDELFAQLGSHRDRALVALWVSTGARAAELLGATVGDVDPGQQLITVIRKGTRAMQPLPAAPDAFVWLRLYQVQLAGVAQAGRDQPLWWTLREPLRPLRYDAARAMFNRANAVLGANWSLHDLRHTAAYRMARDPQMPLTDVQWVLGHARLSTTQRYLNPVTEDVIADILAYHARRRDRDPATPPGPGYRAESLQILFGGAGS